MLFYLLWLSWLCDLLLIFFLINSSYNNLLKYLCCFQLDFDIFFRIGKGIYIFFGSIKREPFFLTYNNYIEKLNNKYLKKLCKSLFGAFRKVPSIIFMLTSWRERELKRI